MKKPKPPKPIRRKGAAGAKASAPVAAAVVQQESWWSKIKTPLTIVGGALGLVITISHFWPYINIESTAAASSSNPLSGYFEVLNEQSYSLEDLKIEASLRCARVGYGNNTAPMEKCEPSFHTSKQRWSKRTLRPHEAFEISPGELMMITPPDAMLYAQISIFVSFKPWVMPFHQTREMRFESRRLEDGKVEWLHIPTD